MSTPAAGNYLKGMGIKKNPPSGNPDDGLLVTGHQRALIT